MHVREQFLSTLTLISFSVVTSVLGQTAIKLGANQLGPVQNLSVGLLIVASMALRSPPIIFGLFMYAMSAFAWMIVLSRLDLSIAYPFVALNFVLITVISKFVFSETVPVIRWLGVAFICVGIVLVAYSARMT